MDYTFKCYDCDIEVELTCPMSEVRGMKVSCPDCGQKISQVYNVPFVTGELPDIYMYDDQELGQVIGKKDRENKMNKLGLMEYQPDPMQKEFDHIERNVAPSKRGQAVNRYAGNAMNVKRGKMVDKKLDTALRTLHVEQPRG